MIRGLDEEARAKAPEFLANLAGKTIFLTGGSGFVGTALVWRLVTDCAVDHVYVLCRGGEK